MEDKFVQALGLLYLACEPLTYDCILTGEEIKARQDLIEHHTFYCKHVELAIQDGVEPLSFGEWSKKAKAFQVNATAYKIDLIDIKDFSDRFTEMFAVETKEEDDGNS